MSHTILRLPAVRSRTGLSRTAIYRRMKCGTFPRSIHLGSSRTTGWIEAEIDDWTEGQIRRACGETIATAIEQTDGLLGGLGAGEAKKASASCMPAVSEAPIEPINARSPSYEQRPNAPRFRGRRMNPEKDPWTDLLIAGFRVDCEKENMTDMDALFAWRMGIEAYKAFRRLGGTLPHDIRRNKR
jgi:prophage regulatory protein